MRNHRHALQNVDFMTRQPTPASSRINGKDAVHIGWFDRPFADIGLMRGWCSHPLRRKQWQFISFTSERYFIGFSTVNVGYLSNFFLYCFDLQTKTLVEFEDKGPGGIKSRIAHNSLTGTSSYTSKYCSISIENHYNDGYYLVTINCRDKKNNSLAGKVKIHVRGDPLVNIREVAPLRLVYTHQSTMYRPEGNLVCNGNAITLNPAVDFAGFDYTQGLHRYKTNWNWAAAGGYATDKTPVSICFSSATGAFYWVDEKIHRVKDIAFSYPDVDSLWQLTSSDSTIDLTFTPQGKRTGRVSVLGLLQSNYLQPFGLFSGTIRPPGREPIRITTLRGVTEEHFARW